MVKPSVSFRFFMFSLSESSGIQPGGRPHATRWTRPSWRRTKAEPGPCYREPPSHLCHLCHGRTLWSQDVSRIFYFFGDFICLYTCMAMCKPSLTFCTLNLSVGSIGSSSQLMSWRKRETSPSMTINQSWWFIKHNWNIYIYLVIWCNLDIRIASHTETYEQQIMKPPISRGSNQCICRTSAPMF